MYKKSKIAIKSKWRPTIKHDFLSGDSDTLVMMLPGGGNTCDIPVMYYLTGMYMKKGYDILHMTYGFQVAQVELDFPDDLVIIQEEVLETLKSLKAYKHVIFVAKSMGTGFLESLSADLPSSESVYLTPLDRTIPNELTSNMFFVYGSNDSLLSESYREKIEDHALVIANANHGLQVKSLPDNLKNLEGIIHAVEAFHEKV